MPTVNSGGVQLAVDVIGVGEPVTVVGHGLTGSRRDLAILAPMITGTKVLFDFRGHGDSGRPPPGSYSMDDFAADVDNVAAAFHATSLVGVSLGGGATLRLLHTKPDRFEKLVFILPARLERSGDARTRLLRLAELLQAMPLPEVADIVMAEEEADGHFDGFPGARDIRRRSILGMNADGIPHAIREAVDARPSATPRRSAGSPLRPWWSVTRETRCTRRRWPESWPRSCRPANWSCSRTGSRCCGRSRR